MIAVKVENTAAARPQVGLSQADIVFVEEVEGAQTRLVAVYHTKFPRRLGPVRSARTTDAQLLPLFGKPGLVYSGRQRTGAAPARRGLTRADLPGDPGQPPGRAAQRVRRPAPRSSAVSGSKAATSIGWTFAEKNEAGGAKADKAAVKVGNDRFDFAYAGGRYTVRWRGAALRRRRHRQGHQGRQRGDHEGAEPAGRQPRTCSARPRCCPRRSAEGQVAIYRDGRKITGTWKRSKVSGPLRFRDSDGQPIALKPGHTWVALKG